jgi:hypothetical protein
VITILLFSWILFVWEQHQIKLGIVYRLQEHFKKFIRQPDPFQNDILNSIPQTTFKVKRDGKWINVSQSSLTEETN